MSVFNYVSDDTSPKEGGGKFGLNHGFITALEYNPNAGANNSPADAVDITVTVKGKEFRSRVYDVTKSLYDNNNQLIQPDEPTYKDLYDKEIKERLKVIVHSIKSLGVTEDQLKESLKTPPETFKEWAQIVCSLVTDMSNPVDVFLEYQWEIKGENDKTYLQLPRNMKGGRFLCPAVKPVGKWQESLTDGLKYFDNDGNIHPFTRNTNYMESNKAIQQFDKSKESIAEVKSESSIKAVW